MKITCLETANFKRIKALRLEPKDKGLTIIGGGNGQGKTQDIAMAIFGESLKDYHKRKGEL